MSVMFWEWPTYKSEIIFSVDGIIGKHGGRYDAKNQEMADARAWGELERELIEAWLVGCWECGCCINDLRTVKILSPWRAQGKNGESFR